MRSFFKLIMLKPRNLPFTFRIIKEMILARIFKYPNPAFLVKDYIFETAIRENPKSVLHAMDNFAKNKRFLMNVEKVPKFSEPLKVTSLIIFSTKKVS